MIFAAPPGGWQVHPRLRTIELRRAWLVGLGSVVLVGGMALFALWRVWNAVDAAWRYGHGVPAASARLVRLSVRSGLIADVHARVAYSDAHGGAHVHEVSLLRVLVTPEPGDPLEIHYAVNEPSLAVSSWERESVSHELGVALVSALLAALVLGGGLREVRTALARLSLTTELTKNGQLSVVELLDTKQDERGFRVMLHYRYGTPGGAVLEGSIASSEGGAYRVAESDTKSLALVSRDGRHGVLLTRSGYPLLNAAEALRQQ